jgi:hypothetical protein
MPELPEKPRYSVCAIPNAAEKPLCLLFLTQSRIVVIRWSQVALFVIVAHLHSDRNGCVSNRCSTNRHSPGRIEVATSELGRVRRDRPAPEKIVVLRP